MLPIYTIYTIYIIYFIYVCWGNHKNMGMTFNITLPMNTSETIAAVVMGQHSHNILKHS